MLAVGFDLYCRLLEESVREQKGEPTPLQTALPALELPIDAYIPDEYLADPRLKMEIYRRLMLLERPQELEEIREEMEDRFGPMPEALQGLFTISRPARPGPQRPGQVDPAAGGRDAHPFFPSLGVAGREAGPSYPAVRPAGGGGKAPKRWRYQYSHPKPFTREVIDLLNLILVEAVSLVPERQVPV